jgi:hypothetical protein
MVIFMTIYFLCVVVVWQRVTTLNLGCCVIIRQKKRECCSVRGRMSNRIIFSEVFVDVYRDIFVWSAFFFFVYLILPYLLPRVFSTLYERIPPQKRNAVTSYLCSLIHHIVVVPVAIHRVMTIENSEFVSSIMLSHSQPLSGHAKAMMHCESAPFMSGYLVADFFLFAIPEALKGKYEFFVHHLLALGVVCIVPYITVEVAPLCSRVMIMEMTSIFFAMAYILRSVGYAKSFVVLLLEGLFASSFFFVRVVSMTRLVLDVYDGLIVNNKTDESQRTLGKCIVALFLPVALLQIYWFVLIVKKTVSRFVLNKSDDVSDDEGEEAGDVSKSPQAKKRD